MDTNSVEVLIRLLAELAPAIVALATLSERIDALDGQTRINRDEIRTNTMLLERLVLNLREAICDRVDRDSDDEDFLP
jgi:hypothetical protein